MSEEPRTIDYQAIADEIRAAHPHRPDLSDDPGTYWDSLAIHAVADAIERVGHRQT